MDASTRFWDRIARKYARTPITDEAAYQEKLRLTQTYLDPDTQMVELACGTGSTAILHAPFVRHVLATDISGGMLEIARRRASEAGIDNIDFRQAPIDALRLPPESADIVLAMNILHLVPDRNDAIRIAHDALKPGGAFVSSTICMQDEFAPMKYVLPAARLVGLAPPVAFFTKAQLTASVQAAGFAIVESWHPGRRKALFLVARKP